jgi:hypothetical protein
MDGSYQKWIEANYQERARLSRPSWAVSGGGM